MKKFLILSVLVLFLGSLMALESGPSETVGFVKYELVAGDFNMVAVPMEITFPIAGAIPMASDLATEIGNVGALIFWDTSLATSGWRTYTGNVVTDFEIHPGDALIANMSAGSNVDFYSAGAVPADVATTFAVDFNMLMVPLTQTAITLASELAASIEADIGAGMVGAIIFWDTSLATSGWRTYTGNIVTDYSIGIGDALIVNALGTGTWNSGSRSSRTTNSIQDFNSQNNKRK